MVDVRVGGQLSARDWAPNGRSGFRLASDHAFTTHACIPCNNTLAAHVIDARDSAVCLTRFVVREGLASLISSVLSASTASILTIALGDEFCRESLAGRPAQELLLRTPFHDDYTETVL